MSKRVTLLLVLLLMAIGLMPIVPACGAIPKPSVPDFTMKYVDLSYDVPPTYEIDQFTGKNVTKQDGYHVNNQSIAFKIKNQPFTSYNDSSGNTIGLYYNFKFKGHYGSEWYNYPFDDTGCSARKYSATFYVLSYDDPKLSASNSEYTDIVLSLSFLFGSSGPSVGSQVDFQVQALLGHIDYEGDGYYGFTGEKSDWSSTQTITVGESQSPSLSPSPSVSQTQISISVDASSTSVGSAVNVKGKVSDLNSHPLQGKSVTLSYALVDSASWVPIGSGTTDEAGEYNIQWVNTASGTFTLKAEFNGNGDYQGASATTTLSFLPYENQNFFYFESNSTVMALAFNNTSSELSFTVEGETGTTGYVKVTIAKTLVSNGANMKVYLDGKQLNYEVTSNADAWLLTFTYAHSSHQVKISLAANTAAVFGTEYWTAIIAVIAIAAIGAGAVVYFKKNKREAGHA